MDGAHDQLEVVYNNDTRDEINLKLLNIKYIKLFKELLIGLFSYHLILIIKCKEFKNILNNLYFELSYNKKFVNQMWVTTLLRKDSFKSFITRFINKFGNKNVDLTDIDNNVPNKSLPIADTEECVTSPEASEENVDNTEDFIFFQDDENNTDNVDFEFVNIDEQAPKIQEVKEHLVERKKNTERHVTFSDQVLLYYIY